MSVSLRLPQPRIPGGEFVVKAPPSGEVSPPRQVGAHLLDRANLFERKFLPEPQSESLTKLFRKIADGPFGGDLELTILEELLGRRSRAREYAQYSRLKAGKTSGKAWHNTPERRFRATRGRPKVDSVAVPTPCSIAPARFVTHRTGDTPNAAFVGGDGRFSCPQRLARPSPDAINRLDAIPDMTAALPQRIQGE
jgi:hypothetical protein